MDAVDDYLSFMVDLSFLEEREELTRSNYGYALKKRWETRVSFMYYSYSFLIILMEIHGSSNLPFVTYDVLVSQRQTGVNGRLYKSHPNAVPRAHAHGTMSPNETNLVHFDSHHRASHAHYLENRSRVAEAARHAHHFNHGKKANGHLHVHHQPIQQPRKMN